MAIELIKLANADFSPTNLFSTFRRGMHNSDCPEKFSSSNSDFEKFQLCKKVFFCPKCHRQMGHFVAPVTYEIGNFNWIWLHHFSSGNKENVLVFATSIFAKRS